MELSTYQINTVRDLVDRSAIDIQTLGEDVLDHLCCLIENKIMEGKLSKILFTISKDAFNGYLKLNGEEPIHLLTKEKKAALVQRLNKIADLLKVKVVDYSADR